MAESLSERRMAENEVIFREYNERIQKGFDDLKQIAIEEGNESILFEDDSPLQYYCECSYKNCRQRVKIKPSRYNRIHKHRDRFILVAGHEIKRIERVIAKYKEFIVVEKYEKPPKTATKLHQT